MSATTEFCGKFAWIPLQVLKDPKLTASAKLVYAGIAESARIEGQKSCWPGEKTLAEKTGLSIRAVQYGLRQLQGFTNTEARKKQEGIVYIGIETRHRPDGSQSSNLYKLLPVFAGGGAGNAGHPPATDAPHEVDVDVEVDKDSYEAKPREEAPCQDDTPRERTFVPAGDTVSYRPLQRERKPPSPRKLQAGKEAKRLWDKYVAPEGIAPTSSTWGIPTLVKAGGTVLALKDSLYKGKTLEELMPLLISRIKTCEPIVRKGINFGWVFCKEANLPRLLAGEWDREAGQEEEKPRKREVPLGDLHPGMDQEAYWRERDAREGAGNESC